MFTAVLAAAAMHASWNALIRTDDDRFASVARLSLCSGLIALILIPFVPIPEGAAWIWLAGSIALHIGYKLFLIQAYAHGDMGQVYPIARGLAPLAVALFGAVWLGERLPPEKVAAVAAIGVGVMLIARGIGRDRRRMAPRALGYALLTAAFTAGYTLADGAGARLAETATGYAVWLFAFDGAGMLAALLVARGAGPLRVGVRDWGQGAAAGMLSMGSYWVAIWAFTKAPIAMVAALRETSVLFAVLIAAAFLRERLTWVRVIAAVLIVGGAAGLRLG